MWSRKKKGFEVGSYDNLYGEQRGKPTAMDFTSAPGFVWPLVLALMFTALYLPIAEACALLLLNAGPRGTGADGP